MKALLYSYHLSSCSFRARIALELAKIKYKYCGIHLLQDGGAQNQKPYRDLNPKGEVPFYVEDGFGISQSMAICLYINDQHLGGSLLPKDLKLKIRCLEMTEIINSGIQPLQNLRLVQEVQKLSDKIERGTWNSLWLERGLPAFEARLKEFSGPYSMGKELSLVDVFLVPQVFNGKRFDFDFSRFPRLWESFNNLMQLASFQKAEPSRQPDAQS